MTLFDGNSEKYQAELYADIAQWVRAMSEAKDAERSLTDTVEKDSVKQDAALRVAGGAAGRAARQYEEGAAKTKEASNSATRTVEENSVKQRVAMDSVGRSSNGMRIGLLGIALAATPLVPVLGALGGVVAALPATFGAAGLAIANFKSLGLGDIAKAASTIETTQQKLAAGTIKQAAANKAMTNATLDLSASQKAALPLWSAWSDTMSGVADISQKKILPALGALGNGIKANMGTIRDSLSASAGSIGGFIRNLSALAQTPLFKAEFATLMRSSASSLGQFLGVMTGGIKSFLAIGNAAAPFVHTLGEMTLGISNAFAAWASSKGGQQSMQTFFSATVQALHLLGDTFHQLGRILVGIFAPAFESSKTLLGGLNDVLKRVADFLNSTQGKQDVRTFWSDVAGAVRSVASGFEALLPSVEKIAAPLYDASKWLVAFVGPGTAGKIAALAIAFKLLSPAINGVAGGLSLLAANPVAAILVGLGIAGYLAYTKIKPFHDEVNKLAGDVQADFPQMRATAQAVFAAIQSYASRTVAFFQSHWPQIKSTAAQVWSGFKDAWETDGKPAFALISDLVSSVVGGIRHNWPQISATARSVWAATTAIFAAAKPLIQANMRAIGIYIQANKVLLDAIKPAASLAFNGLLLAIQAVSGGIQGILSGINSAISGVATALNALKSAYNAVGGALGGGGKLKTTQTGRGGPTGPRAGMRPTAASGAWIDGAYADDLTPIMVTGQEAVLNPMQISMVDAGWPVMAALNATGAPTIQAVTSSQWGGYKGGGKPKSSKLSLAPKDVSKEIVSYNGTIETLTKKLAHEQTDVFTKQSKVRELGNEKRNLARGTPPIAPIGGRKHDPQGYAAYERERANYRQFETHRKAEELRLSNEQAKIHQQIADEERQMRQDRHQLSVAKADLRKLQKQTSKAPNFPAFDSQLTTLLDALGEQTSVLGADGNLSQGSPKTLGSIVSLIQDRITTLKGYLSNPKYKPFVTAIQDELRTDEQNLGQYRKQQYDASVAPNFDLNALLDAGGYTRALAAAGLTDDTSDDKAALSSEQSFLQNLLADPSVAGSNANFVQVANALAGVNQQLQGLAPTNDQSAQIAQLQQQLAIQTRSAGLSDAALQTFGGSGDIGSGGYRSALAAGGAGTIIQNNYMLHPSDPAVLTTIAQAANAGNSLAPSIPSSRTAVNV